MSPGDRNQRGESGKALASRVKASLFCRQCTESLERLSGEWPDRTYVFDRSQGWRMKTLDYRGPGQESGAILGVCCIAEVKGGVALALELQQWRWGGGVNVWETPRK